MAGDEEEDDYLSMTFDDAPAKKETSLQRTARLKKESAERGKTKSKAERAEEERQKLETALATEIDSSNKGAQMMAKMGFKGGALGKTEGARTRPIEVNIKDDRGGIGMESDKKRKIREAAEALGVQEKKVKLNENDYWERNRQEAEDKRHEKQWWAAMRILEGFETDHQSKEENDKRGSDEKQNDSWNGSGRMNAPLQSVRLFWRPLAKARLEKERERRMRYDLDQSLSRRDDYTEDDLDDKLAFGTEVEEDLEEEDTELDEYEALPVVEKLEKTLKYLREKYYYCFWCKYRYADAAMEDCPGLTEDEHG